MWKYSGKQQWVPSIPSSSYVMVVRRKHSCEIYGDHETIDFPTIWWAQILHKTAWMKLISVLSLITLAYFIFRTQKLEIQFLRSFQVQSASQNFIFHIVFVKSMEVTNAFTRACASPNPSSVWGQRYIVRPLVTFE